MKDQQFTNLLNQLWMLAANCTQYPYGPMMAEIDRRLEQMEIYELDVSKRVALRQQLTDGLELLTAFADFYNKSGEFARRALHAAKEEPDGSTSKAT